MFKSIILSIISFFNPIKVVYVEKEVLVEVLSQHAYERLAKQLEPPILSANDTTETASYKLGIQRCLSVVRKDFSN